MVRLYKSSRGFEYLRVIMAQSQMLNLDMRLPYTPDQGHIWQLRRLPPVFVLLNPVLYDLR
jgi:hypothetical protein